jgi:hypothetical protein
MMYQLLLRLFAPVLVPASAIPCASCSDYQAKSGLDSYESAGLDNEVTEGGYEEALAAARMADEELEARDDAAGGRRGRKRMPGALEGACAVTCVLYMRRWLYECANMWTRPGQMLDSMVRSPAYCAACRDAQQDSHVWACSCGQQPETAVLSPAHALCFIQHVLTYATGARLCLQALMTILLLRAAGAWLRSQPWTRMTRRQRWAQLKKISSDA